MGEQSVILEGVAPDLSTVEGREAAAAQAASLCSTVHGAGRVMGRKMATGTFDRKTGVVKREGLVKQEMMNDWMQKSNVVLRGGGLDESQHMATPSACCIRLRRLAWRWREPVSSIPTRIEQEVHEAHC